MKKTLMLCVWTALALSSLVLGCGDPDTDSGGQGGTTLTLTAGSGGGAGGTTETTTSTSNEVEIGPGADCTGDYGISPIDGASDEVFAGFPLVDEGGATLFEDGALACRRAIPPYVPFVVDDWTMLVGLESGVCTLTPSAVSFIAPADADFPLTLDADAQLTETPLPDGAFEATMTPNLTITDPTLAFYACAKLALEDANTRSCISGCRHKGSVVAQNALYSNTTGGLVSALPNIDLELVSVSPTSDAATKLGNTNLDWNITVHGH